MVVDLSPVFNNDEEVINIDATINIDDVIISGENPFVSPVHIKGKIENRTGIVRLLTVSDFLYRTHCDRCYETVERKINTESSHILVSSLNQEDNDEFILVADMRFDVGQLIRDDILLDMPTKFLCDENCKGLCVYCGKNLNEGLCGCKKPIDPRLEILNQLFD